MAQLPVTRRRVGGILSGIGIVGIAGCTGDPDDPDEETPTDDLDGETPTEEPDDETPTEEPDDDTDDADDADDNDDDDDDEESDDGLVRVVHATPDAPNVDVYVDGNSVLEDVPFRAVSNYLTVPAGDYDVMITAAGEADTVVFDDSIVVEAGTAVSLVALGELESETFEVRGFEDDVSPVDEGEARVKVVHAAPDAPVVDVVPAGTDDPLFAELAFGEASDSATVPADAYSLEVRPAGDEDAVASFDVSLDGGTGYTAFAMGYVDPDSAPVDEEFDLTVAVDVD